VAAFDLMDYDARWERYRINLVKGDVQKHEPVLTNLLKRVYEESA
jgi:hypothetical protein